MAKLIISRESFPLTWKHGTGLAAMAAGLAGAPALADALTISKAQTTAVSTASASNGSAGDITVTSDGSVIITDAGPAVTINSSNKLTSAGPLQSSAVSGATAVLVNGAGGIVTAIDNSAAIGVTGAGGSGNYGIRVANGSVTGSITSSSASSLTALGDSSVGLSIEAPFTGNVSVNNVSVAGAHSIGASIAAPLTGGFTLTGTSTNITGVDATGILVAAPVSGGITNNGSLAIGTAATTSTDASGNTTTVPSTAGIAGAHIAASVGGGFLNNRFYTDSTGALVADAAATSSDTLTTASITGTAGTPAVLIAPAAATQGDILLSRVGAAGTDGGYGFVNRGSLTSGGTSSGLSATAVRIAGGQGSNVIVEQGLINQSSAKIGATTIDATATALAIGTGATVPAIVNQGAITSSADADASGTTANSRAIVLEAGSNVASVTNSGSISAGLQGASGSATAILGQSGSLRTIVNSGGISATSATGTDIRAIDLSAASGPITVTNSGTITGDIVFGTGDATYAANSGSLAGALAYGIGANRLSLDGTSVFATPVTLASGGSLAVDLRGSSSLTLGGTAPALSALSLSGQSQLGLGVRSSTAGLVVSGAASFNDQSQIRLIITGPVGSAPFTVLTAGGGIITDHLPTLIGGTSTPFLYTLGNYAIDANALTVTLHQKTGIEAGFTPGTAALFDQSLVAFGDGAAFQAIANLPDQAAVRAAYRQITPPNAGTMPIRLAQSLQSAGAGVIRGRLDAMIVNPAGSDPDSGRITPWIEENVSLLRHADSLNDPGFRSNVFDLSIGADYALAKGFAIGAAGTFAWSDIHMSGMTAVDNKPFHAVSTMGDLYAGWKRGPFFVEAVGGYARNRYVFRRQIDIADLTVTQSARWNGFQLSGDLVGGARFQRGRFTIEPSDALSYIELHQKGYTTTGGGDLDLAVAGKKDKAALNTARLGLGYRLPFGEEAAFDFGIHAGYVTALSKHVNPLSAQFSSGGTPFEMSTVAYHASSFQEGGSVAFDMAGFYLGLTGDRRQEKQYSDNSLALTLRTAF